MDRDLPAKPQAPGKGSDNRHEDGGKRVLLDPNSKSEQDRSYEIVSNDEIRMLGQDGTPVETQLNNSLKREPK